MENCRKFSAKELLVEIHEAQNVLTRQIYQIFAHNELDAILMPGFALPAAKHGDVGVRFFIILGNCNQLLLQYSMERHELPSGINSSDCSEAW